MKEEIDAGRELIRMLNESRIVKAAFWLKASASPHHYLYIASEGIEGATLEIDYRQVSQVMREIQNPDLDGFRIKVIAADNPLARQAVETAEQFPIAIGRRLGGGPFGGVFTDDVYIYPLPLPAVPGEVGSNGDGPNGVPKAPKHSTRYEIVLHRGEKGVSVSVPALPGCWSEGDTEDEALSNIRDAICEYLAALEYRFRDAEVREVEVQV